MTTGGFGDAGLADSISELPLHGRLMQVVSGDPSGAGMRAEGGGSEDVLPAPLDVIRVGGRLDGQGDEALEEMLAGWGD